MDTIRNFQTKPYLLGDVLDDVLCRLHSADPDKLSARRLRNARARLPRLYGSESNNQHRSLIQKALGSHRLDKMVADMFAFSRGGPGAGDPAAADTARALTRHPDLRLTCHCPLQDWLYGTPVDVRRFATQVREMLQDDQDLPRFEVLVTPGRHRDYTHFPGLRWAMELYAWNRSRPHG